MPVADKADFSGDLGYWSVVHRQCPRGGVQAYAQKKCCRGCAGGSAYGATEVFARNP